ncbi:hypothetical protein K438DRAFT_2002685 [Mycena galopus ATCC 62051]|nr:hypothetical protein K438DRAFT_2002685 [Mycena galopus ATCC 62051]
MHKRFSPPSTTLLPPLCYHVQLSTMARTHTSLTSRASRSSCPAPSIISRAAVETAIRMGASKSLATSSCPAPFPSTSHPASHIHQPTVAPRVRSHISRTLRKKATNVPAPSVQALRMAAQRSSGIQPNHPWRPAPMVAALFSLPDIKNLGSRYGIKTAQSKTAVRSFFASLSSPFFLCPAHLDFFLARLQAPIVASATQQHN